MQSIGIYNQFLIGNKSIGTTMITYIETSEYAFIGFNPNFRIQ